MISLQPNHKKNLFSHNTNKDKTQIKGFIGYQQQNSIKNYLISKPILNKNSQSNPAQFNQNKPQQISTKIIQNQNKPLQNQNDQNCSYNANIIQNEFQITSEKFKIPIKQSNNLQKQPNSENIDQLNSTQKLSDQTCKVINLKKKIKKSHHSNPSYNFFRQKVTFKKKIYKLISQHKAQTSLQSQQQKKDKKSKIEVQEGTQTFFVYRDSEIFKSMRSKELINKLVTQRMDNDTETDDEQVEKFVKRMSSDFLDHIEKVKSQAELIGEKKDKCEQVLESEY